MMTITNYRPEGFDERSDQTEVLRQVEAAWDKNDVIVLSANTGAGKSLLLQTIARWRAEKGESSATLTPRVSLQDQYSKSFTDVTVLKGKSRYKCTDTTFRNCEEKNEVCGEFCGSCSYSIDRQTARESQNSVFSVHSYLMLKERKDNLLIDECFGPNQRVRTSNYGSRTIKSIYDAWKRGEDIFVESYNEDTKVFEDKRVTHAWEKVNADKKCVRVRLNTGQYIECSLDHLFHTQVGWRKMAEILDSEFLLLRANNKTSTSFTDDSEQVLLGSILGDGSLTKNPNSDKCRLSIVNKQEELIDFKKAILGGGTKSITKSGYKKEALSHRLVSRTIDASKYTFNYVLKHIDVRGLAIWYMDDGSLKQSNNIILHSNAFSEDQNKALAGMLEERFGIIFKVGKINKKDGRSFFYLRANKEEGTKFLKLVSPYLHKSMSYKTPFPASGENCWDTSGVSSGNFVQIESYEFIDLPMLYDIEVEDNHNFIVTGDKGKGKYRGVVAHNCHSLFSIMSEQSTVQLWQQKVKYPDGMKDYGDVIVWLEKAVAIYEAEAENLKEHVAELKEAEASNSQLIPWVTGLKEVEQAIRKYNRVLHGIRHRPTDYFIEHVVEEYRGKPAKALRIRPTTLEDAMGWLWPSSTKKIVLASATLSQEDIKMLGLSKRRVKWIKAPEAIPVKDKPIIIIPTGNMSYKYQDKAIPKMADKILELQYKHSDTKGLVHAPYSVALKLKKLLGGNSSFIWHTQKDKEERLTEFIDAPAGTVFVASGMHEGLDLAGPEYGYQILTKMPWPSKADKLISYWYDTNMEWVSWMLARDLMQACGRVNRYPGDYAVTYILDQMAGNPKKNRRGALVQFKRHFSEDFMRRIK